MTQYISDSQAVVDALGKVLASSYTLYLCTQNVHWNVVGPHFRSLHSLFEEHYEDLAEAVDEIAERIRILGAPAPGSYSEYQKLSCIKELPTQEISGKDAVTAMVKAHEAVSKLVNDTKSLAQDQNDEVSADLMIGRLAFHEKALWMLKVYLD